MSIEPYQCEVHGESDAYVYKIKTGSARGLWRRTCRKCRAEDVKKQWWKIKTDTISAYGGKCSCCGETELRFLTIDHMEGNGREHRKKIGRGWRFYIWLSKRGYPTKGYRLLCYNCNCARGQYGECPHEKQPTKGE